MPQGDKSASTAKQKRRAEHIEAGCEKKGASTKEAEKRACATVNSQDGGGRRSGSGRRGRGPCPRRQNPAVFSRSSVRLCSVA